MAATTEQTETAPETKATQKATRGARRANVAPAKGKAGKKATPKKKAHKSAKKAPGAREGSKTAAILDLLKRPGGATARELLKATNWQAYWLRGFISGTLGGKMGLTVASAKARTESAAIQSGLETPTSDFFQPPDSTRRLFSFRVVPCSEDSIIYPWRKLSARRAVHDDNRPLARQSTYLHYRPCGERRSRRRNNPRFGGPRFQADAKTLIPHQDAEEAARVRFPREKIGDYARSAAKSD